MLVGRDRERAVLARALDTVAAGRGRAIALTGPPGIGKTSLLDELITLARARDLPAVWGVAWDGAGAPVYWPIVQVLRGLSATAGRASSSVLAATAQSLGARAAGDGHDPADARASLFDRAASAFLALETAAVIAVDDLHAADAATLELLVFLLRATRGAPLLWALAWRTEELGDRSDGLLRGLAALRREVEPLTPAPLAPSDIATLAEREGQALAAGTLADLSARTLGNPLFVVEILRHGDAAALPESVRQAWISRLDRLDAASRSAVEHAAVLGDELGLPALAGMLGAGLEAALARLSAPVGERILHDGGGTRIRFGHPLLREVVLAALAPAARLELHAKAGAALSTLRREGASIPASAVAHQMIAAAPLVAAGALAEPVREAALAAMRLGADAEAAELLERAVNALERSPGGAAPAGELLALRAEALLRAGRREEAFTCADRALERARAAGDAAALARAALARGLELQIGMVDRALIRGLEEALAALPATPSALRARVLARLAAARQPAPDPAEPIAMAHEAVAMADAVAGREDQAIVLFNAGSACADYALPQERAPLNVRTLELATATGERAFAIRAAVRLIIDQLELGDIARAVAYAETLKRLVREVASSRWRWLVHAVDALLLDARGELQAARAESDAAIELAPAAGDPWAFRATHIQRIGILRNTGRPEVLFAHLDALNRTLTNLENPRPGRLQGIALAAFAGRPGARADLGAMTFGEPFDHRPIGLHVWSVAASELDERALAERILPSCAQNRDAWSTWGMTGFIFDGPVARDYGLCLLTAGRAEEAAVVLEAAGRGCTERGLRNAAAYIARDHARALQAAGRSDEAQRRLEHALAEARSMEMPLLEAACARVAIAPITRTEVPALIREGASWRLEHAGRVHVLRDQRGLGMLARLLAEPDQEVHALDLMGASEGVDAGDAGEALDDDAKRAYQRRLTALDETIAAAEARADEDAARRATEEREALTRELSRAFGLGGRARRTGAAAERARVNVQRRLKDALRRIAELEPELAARLEDAVQTGTWCVYRSRARK